MRVLFGAELERQGIHVLSMRNKANRLEELFIRLFDRIPKEMLAIKKLMISAIWRTHVWETPSDPT